VHIDVERRKANTRVEISRVGKPMKKVSSIT